MAGTEVKKTKSNKPIYTYVVSGAEIQCSCGTMHRTLRLKKSHGVYLNNGKAMMNIKDCIPNENIMDFEGCKSPNNPNISIYDVAAKAAILNLGYVVNPAIGSLVVAEAIGDAVSGKHSFEKAADGFSSLMGLGYACKKCIPMFDKHSMSWINGKKDTLVDGQPALINICTIKCIYGGTITIVKTGQEEK